MSEGVVTAFVYILASQFNGTLYIGVTTDLERRMSEHKHSLVPGFTRKHGIKLLVYMEEFHDVRDAIHREKQLKKWNRDWKKNLIEMNNPHWLDLAAIWWRDASQFGESLEIAPNIQATPKLF